jgi:hypothetical protein
MTIMRVMTENGNEYFEVELFIYSNSTSDEDNSRIMETILKIVSRMDSVLYTSGTNVILVSGKWSESDLIEKIDKISKIPGANITIRKKQRIIIRSPSPEHVSISEHVDWFMSKDIIADIIHDIEARNYFKAISTSCQCFQDLGKCLLEKSIHKRIKLEHIIDSLYSKNIINKETHIKMHKIRKYRNPIEHDGAGFRFNSGQAKEAEAVAAESLNICKLLKEKKRIDRHDSP